MRSVGRVADALGVTKRTMKFCFLLIASSMLSACAIFDPATRLANDLDRIAPKPCRDASCIQLHSSEQAYWEDRASQVHPGMRRAEVERLLQLYQPPEHAAAFVGGEFRKDHSGHSETGWYCLSPFFSVTIRYDYTGVEGSPWTSPDQRALTGAVITHRHIYPTANTQ